MKKSLFLFAGAIAIASATFWLTACQQEKADATSAADPTAVEDRANGNSKVYPPSAHPHGKSYEEWSAIWWQQMMTFDCANNPWLNPANVLFYESGPVYFLAGVSTQGASVNVTVPHGKAILFPLINTLNGYPCPPEYNFEPVPPQTLEEFLTETSETAMLGVTDLAVEVDGASVSNLTSYRFTTNVFDYISNSDLTNCFDPCATGSPQPGVGCGYYVMLKPLSKGTHTVHYHSNKAEWEFVQDATYNITVE